MRDCPVVASEADAIALDVVRAGYRDDKARFYASRHRGGRDFEGRPAAAYDDSVPIEARKPPPSEARPKASRSAIHDGPADDRAHRFERRVRGAVSSSGAGVAGVRDSVSNGAAAESDMLP